MFAALGIASYIVAMIATLPASVFLSNSPWRTGVSGTVWEGEVGIAGGSVLSWDWAPLRSLTSLGFAVDWHAAGSDTDLGGRALFGLGGTVIDTVSGSADATLLRALKPDLPFTCALTMQVEMPRIALGGDDQAVEGQIATDSGTCASKDGGTATPLPPLVFTAEPIGDETRMRLTPMAQRRHDLMTATLGDDGATTITMTRDGAATMPFAGIPGGASIETAF